MPVLIPLCSITVTRRNKKTGEHDRVSPTIGVPFDFTNDEVADLRGHTPPAVRLPVNEAIADPAAGL